MANRSKKLETALDKILSGGQAAAGETKQEETLNQPNTKTVGQEASGTVKATYYINKELTKQLKHLAADTDRDLSNLVNEAIQDLLIKYSR